MDGDLGWSNLGSVQENPKNSWILKALEVFWIVVLGLKKRWEKGLVKMVREMGLMVWWWVYNSWESGRWKQFIDDGYGEVIWWNDMIIWCFNLLISSRIGNGKQLVTSRTLPTNLPTLEVVWTDLLEGSCTTSTDIWLVV